MLIIERVMSRWPLIGQNVIVPDHVLRQGPDAAEKAAAAMFEKEWSCANCHTDELCLHTLLDVPTYRQHSQGSKGAGWPFKVLCPQVFGAFCVVWHCALTGLTMHAATKQWKEGAFDDLEAKYVAHFRRHFKFFKKTYVEYYIAASRKMLNMHQAKGQPTGSAGGMPRGRGGGRRRRRRLWKEVGGRVVSRAKLRREAMARTRRWKKVGGRVVARANLRREAMAKPPLLPKV